jgi:hypothetical protein
MLEMEPCSTVTGTDIDLGTEKIFRENFRKSGLVWLLQEMERT